MPPVRDDFASQRILSFSSFSTLSVFSNPPTVFKVVWCPPVRDGFASQRISCFWTLAVFSEPPTIFKVVPCSPVRARVGFASLRIFTVYRHFWYVSRNRRNDQIPWKVIISRDFVVLLFLDTILAQFNQAEHLSVPVRCVLSRRSS